VRTDVKIIKGADTFCIDVAIVGPAAAVFLKPPTRSHLTQDGAAFKYERTKRQHYARVNSPSALPSRSTIPFVIEVTGRLARFFCPHLSPLPILESTLFQIEVPA
jgi:hypothetical protein